MKYELRWRSGAYGFSDTLQFARDHIEFELHVTLQDRAGVELIDISEARYVDSEERVCRELDELLRLLGFNEYELSEFISEAIADKASLEREKYA